jgi:Flp pilus assembly protein TadG
VLTVPKHHLKASRSEQGAAFVELAVTLPVLMVIVLGTIDFGRAFYTAIELNNAARAGAQYGAHSLAHAANHAGIIAAGKAASPDIAPYEVVQEELVCECASSSSPSVSSVACTGTCPGGQHLVVNVPVVASKTFSTYSMFPGVPNTFQIERAATMRAQ